MKIDARHSRPRPSTHDLRVLIRGIIWQDEHFQGMTIREIAKRDKRSDAFVGGMIRKSLEIA